MRTLPPSASTFRYVTHARYVARSLAVAGRREQSQRIRAAADKLPFVASAAKWRRCSQSVIC